MQNPCMPAESSLVLFMHLTPGYLCDLSLAMLKLVLAYPEGLPNVHLKVATSL